VVFPLSNCGAFDPELVLVQTLPSLRPWRSVALSKHNMGISGKFARPQYLMLNLFRSDREDHRPVVNGTSLLRAEIRCHEEADRSGLFPPGVMLARGGCSSTVV
jgi:hypothetical protein